MSRFRRWRGSATGLFAAIDDLIAQMDERDPIEDHSQPVVLRDK